VYMVESAQRRKHRQFKAGDTPFSQALTKAIQEAGYPNQSVYAERLGIAPSRLNRYTRGRMAPTPDMMGRMLQTLQPSDERLDALIEPWGELVAAGIRGLKAGSQAALRASKKLRSPTVVPLAEWLNHYADTHAMSLTEAARRMGVARASISSGHVSVQLMSELLQEASSSSEFTEADRDGLSEAIAQTIEEYIARGRHLTSRRGTGTVRHLQQEASCILYTGTQAAAELGVTSEYVRQLRSKLGIDHSLLTQQELEQLRSYRQYRHSSPRRRTFNKDWR
jgi:transcriptional regulator with XRE-family HTH domain